jgi:hypothetical protein
MLMASSTPMSHAGRRTFGVAQFGRRVLERMCRALCILQGSWRVVG